MENRSTSLKLAVLGILAMPLLLIGQSSLNMTLQSNWQDNNIPISSLGTRYNDVWGYASGGREYAIVGGSNGAHIIDVTIPTAPNPVALATNSVASSAWRDFDVYGNYLYTVCDNSPMASFQVFDLSNLPTSITKVFDSQAFFAQAHTIFIDQSRGRLYVSGSDTQPNGVLIFDIQTNPASPALLANFVLGAYTHDVFVLRDTCYGFFGGGGTVASFDFSDLNNPSALGMLFSYPEIGYAHSGWTTPGMEYLYFATETHNTGIHIADIRNPFSINHMNTFRSSLLAPTHQNSIGHNPVIRDSILYVAYYQDGVQAWDVRIPSAPVRLGYYDTHPQNTDYTGMRGAWSIYPFLPSGNILVSDTDNGLFVVRNNFTLPVELSGFTAVKRDEKVVLSWRTESESNNSGFGIERSENGIQFQEIGFVEGAGNAVSSIDYEFIDDSPLQGITYYRLRQMDNNGQSTHSDVVTVTASKALQLLAVYPTPVQAGNLIEVLIANEESSTILLSLSNTLGQEVWNWKEDVGTGQFSLQVPTRDLAAGSYILKVAGNGQVATQRVVVTEVN